MADPQRLDSALRVLIGTVLIVIVGVGAWFGYSIYTNNIAAESANPALRVIRDMEAQVARNPNDPVLRIRLGEADGSAGRSQAAIEQFNAALKIDPKNTGAYLDLGTLAMLDNHPDEARGYFKKVLDLTADNPMANSDDRRDTAYFSLGRLEMDEKNWEEAIGDFKAALRINNSASDTYFYLAQSLSEINQDADAATNAAIALKFDPNFAQAHYLLGKLYLESGDKIRAAAEIGRAIQLSPDSPEPKALAAQIGDPEKLYAQATSLASTDTSAAARDAAIAFNLDPTNQVAAGKLEATLLLKLGNKKGALAVYKNLSTVAPKDAVVKAALKSLSPKKQASVSASSTSGN
jgi:tetratricopeptide (TPR) repeat protein